MRKSLLLLLSICFIITSCSRFDLFTKEDSFHYGILKDISDSIKQNPSCALSMIEDFSTAPDFRNIKRSEFFEYHILLAEARYKCDLQSTNEIEISQAVSFFDSLTNYHPNNKELTFMNSKAYYYKGVIEEEKENYKEAFIYYLKSLSLIDKIKIYHKEKDDITHFKALTFVRLSDILYWLDAYDASIDCLNNANILFTHNKHFNAIIRNNILIAMMHGHSFNYEETLRHLSKADSLLEIHDKNSDYKYVIERMYASVMYNFGYKEESFKKMLNQYKTLESSNLKMEAAGVLGDMYYSMGILDSAIYYYEQYFPDNKYSKIDAANHIIEISLKTGNNELITKYAPALTNETKKELQLSKIKTEMSSLYEQYVDSKRNEKVSKTILMSLTIILIITLLFFTFCMYLLHLKRKNYYNEIVKKDFYINTLQDKFNKKTSENKHIRQRIKNLEDEIQDIKTKRYLNIAPFDLKLKELINNNQLCQELAEISLDDSIKTNTKYPDLILNEDKQKELIEIFSSTFNNVFNTIISKHEGLKPSDELYFCLYLIGLNEKHISAVTGKTYNIIYNRTKKIKEIFGSNKNIKEIIRDNIIATS